MTGPSATHRGAPFAGRRREIGLLAHLLEIALDGPVGVVRVAGPTGAGRRRLISETLAHGPDAEWIHLAPGGVEIDLRRWVHTELPDLLDSYPGAPVPSWALHVLARWSPSLGRRARVPALSPEPLPAGRLPEIFGSAVGGVLRALTGRTLVVVETGIWPSPATPRARALAAIGRALEVPGGVALAATGPGDAHRVDPPGMRTLELGPLRPEDVDELLSLWGSRDPEWGEWLFRVSGGSPFFLHEVVRWLEEMGHVRVDEEARRVARLSPVDQLPLPLSPAAVMAGRRERLEEESVRLLSVLAASDGREELETLRRGWARDEESFDEALAGLRRREFLLRRSPRAPLALASPLWRGLVPEGAGEEATRRDRDPVPADDAPRLTNPLARVLDRLDHLRGDPPAPEERGSIHQELEEIWRRLADRPGAAWVAARGRTACLAARLACRDDHGHTARTWVERGLGELDPERHPSLRRALYHTEASLRERSREVREAQAVRERALRESERAGHAVAAARIAIAVAEGRRRFGDLAGAEALAARAEQTLAAMGLNDTASLARATRIAALLDARRLDEAEQELEREELPPNLHGPLSDRLESLNRAAPSPDVESVRARGTWTGWGWGLDADSPWGSTRALKPALDSGYLPLAADLAEAALARMQFRRGAAPSLERLAARLGEILRRLDCPTRTAHLARALQASLTGTPAYDRHFRLSLLRSVSPPSPEESESIRVTLTGLPAVTRRDRSWPASLWPEWWGVLWGEAAAGEILGDLPTAHEAASLLSRSGDLPHGSLEAAVRLANDLAVGGARIAGGLVLDRGRLTLVRSGITCDLWEALAAFHRADSLAAAGEPGAVAGAAAGLDRIGGEILPGVDGPRLTRLRALVADRASRALEAALAEELPEPVRLARWLEGVGRVIPVASRVAPLLEQAGYPVSALALRLGSP